MARPTSQDREKALSLLQAALGDFNPNQPLSKIIAQLPEFGKFEWMLTILGLEIDLRVDIPEAVADDLKRTAQNFCKLVAGLPKVDSPGYTLECLGLVAQALLSLDLPTEPPPRQSQKLSAHKAAARSSTAQRTKATKAKRSARTVAGAKGSSKGSAAGAGKRSRKSGTTVGVRH
jgi:hypothetical protein